MRLLILACILFISISGVYAQRTAPTDDLRPEPKLYFKKTNSEVTGRTGVRTTRKLLDPNDKAKWVDFSVENIGNTQGLVVVSESLDEKYNNWKVVIKNKGVKKSENSVYVVMVTKYVSEKLTAQNPFPTTKSAVIYQDHKILPKLNPGEEMTTWFSLEKSGLPIGTKSPFGEALSNLGPTNVSYKIQSYFVTEMVIGK